MADALATVPNDRSDLAELEEIERQVGRGVNQPERRRGGWGWELSPSITRASASRESKKPQLPVASKPAAATPAPMTAPIRSSSMPGYEPYRVITDYEALQDGFADRIHELDVPMIEIDAIGDLTMGNTQKLLSKSDAKWARRFGWVSLGKMLKATGLVLVLMIDDERFAPIREQMAKRRRPLPHRKLLPPPAARPDDRE